MRKREYTGGNEGYWITNWLEDEYLKVLQRIADGLQRFDRDKFQVAYLISQDCVEADCKNCTLAVTAKGKDALAFFDVA